MIRRVATMIVAALFMAGCTAPAAVWVDVGRTDSAPVVFRLGPKTGIPRATKIEACLVYGCDRKHAGIFWSVWSDRRLTAVDSIVYGIVPPGFHEGEAVHPLTPGCYYGEIHDGTLDASSSTVFEIGANGTTIRPLKAPQWNR